MSGAFSLVGITINKAPERYPGPSEVAVEMATDLLHNQHMREQGAFSCSNGSPYCVGRMLTPLFDVVVKATVTGFGSLLAVTNTTVSED